MNKQQFTEKYGTESIGLIFDAAITVVGEAGYSKLKELLTELKLDINTLTPNQGD